MKNRKKSSPKKIQLDFFDDLVQEANKGDRSAIFKLLARSGRGYDASDEEIDKTFMRCS